MNCSPEALLNLSKESSEIFTKCDSFPTFDQLKKGKNTIIEEILENSYITPHQDVGNRLGDRVNVGKEICVMLDNQTPLQLKQDEAMGRCLVAARDIEPGEVFLKDWPLITAPNAGESKTCLGCCFIVSELQDCQRCGWPVCNESCSNIPQHAEFECKIFAKENIKPKLPSPYNLIASAEYIKMLRCLLLKQEDCPEKMKKWEQILSLEAHLDLRRDIPKVQFMSGLVNRFVRSLCKLTMYESSTIETILGCVDVNAFRHSFPPAPLKTGPDTPHVLTKNATFLYPVASLVSHGCVRNTDWKTLEGGQLAMRASHKISQGQVILHAYVDLMQGTPDRRRQLRNQFYFDCQCERCSDPTELNTYFSALKCTKCKEGYLLAENPLDYKSNWVCNNASNNNCTEIKPYGYERNLTQQIFAEEKQIIDQIRNQTNIITIKQLMKVLKKHKDVTVHPNHYRLIAIEYTLARHLFQIPKPPVEVMLEIKRLIKRHMRLSTVFHPCADDN